MKISFTGISDPCYMLIRNPNLKNEVIYAYSSIVKDDRYGNDYSDYIKAINRGKGKHCYISDISPNLVSLMIKKITDKNTLRSIYAFRLNGTELPINTETMPIFDSLAVFTKKIANTNENNIMVNRDYIYSDELRYGLIPGIDLKEFFLKGKNNTKSYEEIANNIRHPRNAKDGAQIINVTIFEAMVDYFA